MTKQEEIREGLHKALQGDNPTVVGEPCPYCRDTGIALNYLHSQGVVIKVERELPTFIEQARNWGAVKQIRDRLAGYEAVEPLQEFEKEVGYEE